MGTVCYAPDIPLINRPINPYNGLPISRESVRNSMVNHSLARKMNEDYQVPLLANSLMKPSNLNQLPLANSVQVTTTTTTTPILPVPVATVSVPIGTYEPNSIVQKLRISPEAMAHAPPADLASPCNIPPVTQWIIQRRKRLSPFRFEGLTKGTQLGPYKYHTDDIIYLGQWKLGTPHGKGLIYFPDGSVFEGGFCDGKSIGKGRLISRNGDYYQGDVASNVASGIGISQNNVIRYQGQFQNNLPHGQGVETSIDGRSRFLGTFYEGTKVSGVLTWGDHGEFIYEGRFANNTFNGRGVLKTADGTYYGDFVNGHKHGVGEMYSPEGALVFRGNWLNDVPESAGVNYSQLY